MPSLKFFAAILTLAIPMASETMVAAPAQAQILPSAPVALSSDGLSQEGFQSYLQSLWLKAQAMGVRRTTFDSVLSGLTFNPRVIELDRQQPEGSGNSVIPAFAPYRESHVDAARIARGREKYAALRPLLRRIEIETGVPEAMMIAIYGHETNYGRVMGDFDLPRSLASLAYEGRRRSLFEAEFLATLKMLDTGYPRGELIGSWAGAFGYPQFLPTVYLRLARDGDGDGKAQIRTSEADAMVSIANYFRQAGWRRGQPWGFAVTAPATLDRADARTRLMAPRCPRVFARHSRWRSIAEWKALGVLPQAGAWPVSDTVQASLIEPDGIGQTAYLITGNYRVILDYNCSNFYALSVGLLADEVSR